MTPDETLHASMTRLLHGETPPDSAWPQDAHAWRLLRWEADLPLTDEERASLLAAVDKAMALAGVSAACFSADGDVMTILLCSPASPPAPTGKR